MRWKSTLLIAFLVAFLMVGACPALAEGDDMTAYRAMLIGIESYDGGVVEGCLTDVNRVASLLQAANEAGARYLTPVTRTNLKAAEIRDVTADMLGWGVDNDDVTLFYYSGLGMITDDGEASLTARNGEPVRLKELRAALDQLPGTKIILFDARYLESIASASKRTPAQLVSLFNRAVVNAFTGGMTERDYQVLSSMTMVNSASASGQFLGLPCGPFTYYLCQACGFDYTSQQSGELMADVNQNGAVSIAEARDYIQAGLARLAKDAGMEPVYDIAISPQDGSYPLFSNRTTAETMSVTLDQPALSLAAGTSARLTATVLPQNAQQKGVSWISSDLGICTVDENGQVTGVRPGTAKVSCVSANGLTDDCNIMVRDVVFAESVSLNASKLVIGTGQKQTLQLIIKPSNSNELVTWRSNDNSVATVDQDGTVSLIRTGSAIITATTESGKEVSCVVQAVDPENVVTGVAVDAGEISLYEGEARLIVAKVRPAKAIDQMVNWSTSDDKIAQVEANGLIAGVGGGDCIITCTASSGVTAQVKVHVKPTLIELKRKSATMKPGTSGKLSYSLKPVGTVTSITWESSAPEVATVNESGEVTAISDGLAAITASLPSGQKATCQLSVASVSVTAVRLNKQKLTLSVGDTFQMESKVAPSNASLPDVTWVTSNEDIVSVAEDGSLIAVGIGKCHIGARTHNGKTAKCAVVVNPPKVSGITLSSTEETFKLGSDTEFQLDATIEPDTTAGNRALKWQSSDKSVVTVGQDGLVKIVGEGKAIVRASGGNVKADCRITVVTNRTYNSKPKYGDGRDVYPSLRQVAYSDGDLMVQMYFFNRTKSVATVPTQGALKLVLRSGEAFELVDGSTPNPIQLGSNDYEYFTYRFDLEGNPQLADLDLSGATVELLPPSSGPVEAADSLTTTGRIDTYT